MEAIDNKEIPDEYPFNYLFCIETYFMKKGTT